MSAQPITRCRGIEKVAKKKASKKRPAVKKKPPKKKPDIPKIDAASEEFDVAKLIIMRDRPDLCRMVVTWSQVDHKLKGKYLLADWSILARVPVRVMIINRGIIERLNIIGKNGQVEPMAMFLVREMMMNMLKGGRR